MSIASKDVDSLAEYYRRIPVFFPPNQRDKVSAHTQAHERRGEQAEAQDAMHKPRCNRSTGKETTGGPTKQGAAQFKAVRHEPKTEKHLPARPRNRQDAESGGILFSKFEFDEDTAKKRRTLSDPKQALARVVHRKAQIEAVRHSDPSAALSIEQKEAWSSAILRAQGVKMKDDETRLKKSVRRVEKLKSKSKQMWGKKSREVRRAKEKKQQKRTVNIQTRKERGKKHKK